MVGFLGSTGRMGERRNGRFANLERLAEQTAKLG